MPSRARPASGSRIPDPGSRIPATKVLSPAMRRSVKAAGIGAALLLAGGWAGNGYLRAAAFVVQAAGMEGYARTAASVETGGFDEHALTIPWRGGRLRARLYVPRGASD